MVAGEAPFRCADTRHQLCGQPIRSLSTKHMVYLLNTACRLLIHLFYLLDCVWYI